MPPADFSILTPRLVIRPPVLADAADIQPAKDDLWPELQKWMSWSSEENRPIEATQNWIRRGMAQAEAGQHDLPLIARCRTSGAFVGSSGVHPSPRHEAGYPAYSTGYWVARAFQGQGLATELCNAAIRYGFLKLGLESIAIQHYAGNEPSRRIIEKLGFVHLFTLPLSHRSFFDGQMLDDLHYALTGLAPLPPLDIEYRHTAAGA